MKLRTAILIIFVIILVDQVLKIWIKTTYPLGHIRDVFGFHWFQLYFIENKGMAWGLEWGGEWGKIFLTLFRLAAVIFGTWYIGKIVREKYSKGFIICAALIYAGALGNLIDSLFYGLVFEESTYSQVARMFPEKGYATFLHGKVVDMLYFPIIRTTFPDWLPFVGGRPFEFFSPIFNIADASISIGVITLLLFQKRLVRKEAPDEEHPTVTTNSTVSDQAQVM
ncbi:MAG TPA: lipoprotein signal peptidase [Flavisolibacter sp.]